MRLFEGAPVWWELKGNQMKEHNLWFPLTKGSPYAHQQLCQALPRPQLSATIAQPRRALASRRVEGENPLLVEPVQGFLGQVKTRHKRTGNASCFGM